MTSQSAHDKAQLEHLAKLPPLQLARELEEASKDLKVTKTELRAAVKAKRQELEAAKHRQELPIIPAATPWPYPVDGAELLDAIAAEVRDHVIVPKGGAETTALWSVMTHCHDAFQKAPYLSILSPFAECGKSTFLEVLAGVSHHALLVSGATAAVVFRVIKSEKPTLLLDELDAYYASQELFRDILDAAHSKSSCILRSIAVGDNYEPGGFPVWAPLAFAAIEGGEYNFHVPRTVKSRSIEIPMRRAKPSEAGKLKEITPETRDRWRILRAKAARFAQDHLKEIAAHNPESEFVNRLKDNWRPLFAIADIAGGEWPQRAREAAKALIGSDDDHPERAKVLLGDILECIADFKTDRVTTEGLCTALAQLPDSAWLTCNRGREIDGDQLAKLLRPLKIKPKKMRFPGFQKPRQGYEIVWFREVAEWVFGADVNFTLENGPLPGTPGTNEQNQSDSGSAEGGTKGAEGGTSPATEAQHALTIAFEAEERAKRAEGQLKAARAMLTVSRMKPSAALALLKGGKEDDAA